MLTAPQGVSPALLTLAWRQFAPFASPNTVTHLQGWRERGWEDVLAGLVLTEARRTKSRNNFHVHAEQPSSTC